jgi:hypothetical protein
MWEVVTQPWDSATEIAQILLAETGWVYWALISLKQINIEEEQMWQILVWKWNGEYRDDVIGAQPEKEASKDNERYDQRCGICD